MIFISGSGLCVFFFLRGGVTRRAYFIGGANKEERENLQSHNRDEI